MAFSSFLPVSSDSPFSINNIPFGVFSTKANSTARVGVAIGTYILDVKALVHAGIFERYCECKFPYDTLSKTTLNEFAALGRTISAATRLFIQHLLLNTTHILRDDIKLRTQSLIEQADATMHLPFAIGDFTDFLNSRTHARNTHSSHETPVNMFNPPRAFPGRASSVLPSGTPIVRPIGHLFDEHGKPFVGPSKELDVEVELAFFVGVPNDRFSRVPITKAEDHIFGVVMLNDWSTRDVQRGEDFPFAAFNAKNFASTISPWVVTLDALEPFRIPPQPRDEGDMLPYLTDPKDSTYDIHIRMDWKIAETGEIFQASRSHLQNAYWTFKQMLTFHTLSGCPMRTGDLVGTGTITGEDSSSYCSLVEMTRNNTRKITTPNGTVRSFVEDGDEVVFTAWCGDEADAGLIGFGECGGLILPSEF
ncbi:fumarylacetoacetase [Leucogyrophana mollusca]|uniref:Fumarylacetoacetase n=1 Tax=Leucogyrophana mollusca TaxID=85980 RepID=A0ACB8B9Y1_9AGAM|nr:fumarylacetoacetase [Leucogyrophana mollusca]